MISGIYGDYVSPIGELSSGTGIATGGAVQTKYVYLENNQKKVSKYPYIRIKKINEEEIKKSKIKIVDLSEE